MHRILVIGVGSIGERHLRCLQATGRAEVGICEINTGLREGIASKYSVSCVYPALEQALRESWEAAVIATPANLHIEQAMRCAETGLHLLIEKPLSTSLRGVESLLEVVKTHSLVAAVGYVYRAHPALAAMKKALSSGDFGCPVQLTVSAGQHFPLYRPAYRQTYYRDHATGGGAIQDALTHLINAAEWLIGPTTWVAADASHKILDAVEVEDSVTAIARHGDVLASYSLNQHQAPNEISMTVVAERGTLRFELHHSRWSWMREPGGAWQEERVGPLERDEWFILQEQSFLDALERQRSPLCSLEDGVQTLRVNLAMLQSVREGARRICLNGRSAGDEEAR